MKPWLLTCVAVVVLAASGCASSAEREGVTTSTSATTTPTTATTTRGAQLHVVVGSYPLAWLVHELGVPMSNITNATAPGAEPTKATLAPALAATVQDADVIVTMGRGYQPALEHQLLSAKTKQGAKLIVVLDIPGTLLLDAADQPWSPGDRTKVDPNVWLDPVRFKTIGFSVASILGTDPEQMRGDLTGLAIRDKINLTACARTTFSTAAGSFRYLAGRYGLQQVAGGRGAPAIGGIDTIASPTGAQVEADQGYLELQAANALALRAGLGCTNPLS